MIAVKKWVGTSVGPRASKIFTLVFLLLCAVGVRAEEHPAEEHTAEVVSSDPESGEPESSDPEAVEEGASEDQTPTPTATVEHVVEPLDAWVVTPAAPKPTASATPTATPTGVEEVIAPGPSAASGPRKRTMAEMYGPRAYRQALSKTQQKRLRRLIPIQRSVARELRIKADPRGEPELRVCTAHLNNFGPATEFKRLMKGEGAEKRLARERSAVSAIAAVGCDVVAFQAIYGVSFTRAHEAVDGLVKKLEKATDASWEVQLEEGTKQLLWSGFLVREGVGQVLRSESIGGVRPAPFGPAPIKDLARAPSTLSIKVKGKGTAQSKIVTLINFDMRHSLGAKTPDTAFIRVQLAELLRGLVEKATLQDQVVNPQLLVLLGDRNDVRNSAAAQVVEGQLRLLDFTEEGTCKLEGEKELKLRCHNLQRKPKLLFGVVSENALVGRRKGTAKKTVEHEGEEPPAKRPPPVVETRTTEIYLTQRDLKYARLLSDSFRRYRVGTAPLRNGLADSPLTWVELNWP